MKLHTLYNKWVLREPNRVRDIFGRVPAERAFGADRVVRTTNLIRIMPA